MRAALLVGLLLAALLAGGCGRAAREGAGVYRAPLPSDILGFDPATANDVPTARVLGATHAALLQYAYLERPYRVVPDLAAAWPEVSEDGRTWTFRLRDDVRYHPDPCFGPAGTRAVRAGDLVHAFQRIADPAVASGGWWVLDGWIEGLAEWRAAGADYDAPVRGLRAPDEDTFVLRLTRPYPQLRYVLTMVCTAPVPPEATAAYGKDLRERCIGTGPFRLREWVRGSRITLERNPDYRDERYPASGSAWARESGLLADAGRRLPLADGVVYKILPEPQAAWLEFRAGGLDRAEIPKDSVQQVIQPGAGLAPELEAEGLRLQRSESQTMWWIECNLRDPAFQGEAGLQLRRAIGLAHDAARFVRVLHAGRGAPARSYWPPGVPGYALPPEEWAPRHDPEAARAALARAGYPGGEGAPRLRLDLRGPDPQSRQEGEYLASELRALGLEVELVSNTYQGYLQKAKQGKLQLYLRRWIGDYPDAENWTQLLWSANRAPGPNWSGHSDPEYDRLHEETRAMEDSPERRRKLARMIEIAARAQVMRPSFVPTLEVLHHERLRNFMLGEPIYNAQKYLRVDPRR